MPGAEPAAKNRFQLAMIQLFEAGYDIHVDVTKFGPGMGGKVGFGKNNYRAHTWAEEMGMVAYPGQPQLFNRAVQQVFQDFRMVDPFGGYAPQLEHPMVDVWCGMAWSGYTEPVRDQLAGFRFLRVRTNLGLVVQRCFLSPPDDRLFGLNKSDDWTAWRGVTADRGSTCRCGFPR